MRSKKLWASKGRETADWVEDFTVGQDRLLDEKLAIADIYGSIAHAKMLSDVSLINKKEGCDLVAALQRLLKQVEQEGFQIDEGMEDVHSQIEALLVEQLGDTGKKIHTGRSRNDQVLVALKIYFRHQILEITQKIEALVQCFLQQADTYKNVVLPGYTHLQVAMPSSFGLWFSAYAESLIDDLMQWKAAFRLSNRNPLGSGAGYGSTFPLDRAKTTQLLGFEGLHQNVVYAQLSRGRTELSVAQAIAATAQSLNRFAMDVCLYASQNFGFIALPEELTTGSSIMPHKKNPDVFEILRGRSNLLMALPGNVSQLMVNLPSGYHREFQLLKELIFPALEHTHACLEASLKAVAEIKPVEGLIEQPIYTYLSTVDVVHDEVKKGVSFRDAYRVVAEQVKSGNFKGQGVTIAEHQLQGGMGNLGLKELELRLEQEIQSFGFDHILACEKSLAGLEQS